MTRHTRIAMAIVLLVTVAACAHQPAVQVPVAVPCPAPPPVVRPKLLVTGLTQATPPDQVMKALIASLEILAGYAGELETLLDGYRKGGTGGR